MKREIKITNNVIESERIQRKNEGKSKVEEA